MDPPVPATTRIDRAALERIVRRAAELQAQEREIGEGLTDDELLALGRDVGIPDAYLRRALLEERARSALPPERGPLVWLAGPRLVAAARTVPGTVEEVSRALHRWMTEGELLQVKRRYPDGMSWERQEGAFASIKRSLGIGGRRYVLARTREVLSKVLPVDRDRSYVQLVADVSNSFREYLTGSTVVAAGGLAASGLSFVLGVLAPVAVLPGLLTIPLAGAILRSRRGEVERCQVALEQVLDRVEHGEVGSRDRERSAAGFGRLADEIKRTLGA